MREIRPYLLNFSYLTPFPNTPLYEKTKDLLVTQNYTQWDDLMQEVLGKKRKSTGVVLLVDAHLYHYKHGEMIEDSTDWMRGLDGIFLVSTDVGSLNLRVTRDEKSRDLLPDGLEEDERVRMLTFFLDTTEKRARKIAKKYGIPFYKIRNLENGAEIAIQDFLRIHAKMGKV